MKLENNMTSEVLKFTNFKRKGNRFMILWTYFGKLLSFWETNRGKKSEVKGKHKRFVNSQVPYAVSFLLIIDLGKRLCDHKSHVLGLFVENAVVFYMSHERETTKGLDYSWFFSSTRSLPWETHEQPLEIRFYFPKVMAANNNK